MSSEKITIDMGKVTENLKMKFLISFSDNNPQFPSRMIKSYRYNDSDYFRITPRPLISFEITGVDNTKEFIGFCLTKYLTFRMINTLKEFVKSYEDKDLFYIDKDGILSISQFKQKEKEAYIPVCNNKVLYLIPGVVHVKDDGGTGRKDYEGCILYVGNKYSYVYLTYEEINYLIYTLEKVDFDGWAIQIMNSYKLYKNDIEKEMYNTSITENDLRGNSQLTGRGYNLEQKREVPDLG